MTDEQRDEMTRLDAVIAANPGDVSALETRARLWARCHYQDEALADCLAAWLLVSNVSAREWTAHGENYDSQRPQYISPTTDLWTIVQAATCFSLALQSAPANAALHTRRARAYLDLGREKSARLDLERARELDGESAERWHLWARLYDKNHAARPASDAYKSALRIEIEAEKWPRDPEFYARQAAQMKARWQEWAWLDLALEIQPDNAAWLRQRADLASHTRQQAAAYADYSRLIELAPDDLALYEARAVCAASTTHLYEIPVAERANFPSQTQARADFAHVLRAQIARGQQCGQAWFLRMCGDEIKTPHRRQFPNQRENLARAHAFYTVAIEVAPDQPGLYRARARVTTPDFLEPPLFAAPQFGDYLGALRLKPNFRAPRKKIIGLLARMFKSLTAHEQLEALLNARAELRARGLRPKLVGQILREVARALAN